MLVALRVVGGSLAGHRDVVVRAEHTDTVAEVGAALADHLGIAVPGLLSQRTGRPVPAGCAFNASGLVTGDVVIIGADAEVVLDVVAGRDAGVSHVMGSGRSIVGRGAAVDVALTDPTVSRRHAEIDITGPRIGLTPIGAVLVNGLPIDGATMLNPGDVITLGATQLTARPVGSAASTDRRQCRDGAIQFRRTPYRQPTVADRGTLTIGPVPERCEARRMQILSIAGPLLAGLVLFAFMRRVEFLALTLLSPVLLIATTLDERRSGRRSRRAELATFRSMLDDRLRQVAGMREAERAERFAAAPDLADLASRAEHTTLELWARGRGSDDFLRLRVGTGTVPTRFDVALVAGGQAHLRDEAAEVFTRATTIEGVPVTIDLARDSIAIHGDSDRVGGVAAALVVQAACLHAPEDLVMMVAISPERSCDWIKWLPHLRTMTRPGAPCLARSRCDADAIVLSLLDTARRRSAAGSTPAASDAEPHVLALLDAALVTDESAVGRLLELAPAAGISIVWLASGAGDVPHLIGRVLEAGGSGRLWSTERGSEPLAVTLEPAQAALAERLARALAPVRDVADRQPAGVPADAALLDVLGHGATSSSTLVRWWQRSAQLELRLPLGVGPSGPIEIDLVESGPHALIAGTTGSGKSELLQSAVTSMAARYSPQRVNFLFVDYKGGAATKVFEHLPHTVGYVTNLDAALARRAIVSLRAELERRMALLEGRAKDLRELLARAPAEAPASLVIVIDEFATLAKQLPDFVAGVVDIAQRGRSLGIHLVLSTQRLSGAVDENIVANANVRVALRLLDRADSTAMIGSAAAAEVPVAARGRGLVRIGSGRPVPFQACYGGRRLEVAVGPQSIDVATFTDPSQLVAAQTIGTEATVSGGETQQAAVLAAVTGAGAALRIPSPRRPCLDPLPSVVILDTLGDWRRVGEPVGCQPAIGVFDAPETQEQGPLIVDLERGGGCLIFGSGGSGKTTAVRSMALALTRPASGSQEPVALIGFDCASRGLTMLRALPHVVDIATSDDPEAVSRHIVMLDRELVRRRQLLSAACAEQLSAYNAGNPALPRIVVLIDDIGALVELLGGHGGPSLATGETWSERLVRVLIDGRPVGIHGVVTADRRSAVPARLHAAVSNRIVLGHADRLAYADHGVPADAPEVSELTPGRGWWNGTTVIQVAVASSEHSARGQRVAIEHAAAAARDFSPPDVMRSAPLPERVTVGSGRRCSAPLTAAIGVADVTCGELLLDLTASHVAVIGRPRSGKSTALVTIAAGLAGAHELYAVGTAASGLAEASIERAAFGAPQEIAPLLEEVVDRVESGQDPRGAAVLLVDDLDLVDDIGLARAWERLATLSGLRIVAAVDVAAMSGFTSNPVASALKRSRRMLVLQPDDPGEFLQLTGVRLDARPGTRWVPGRGVLVADRVPHVLQVATSDGRSRRTHVRSGGTVSGVTVMTRQTLPTAAVGTASRR